MKKILLFIIAICVSHFANSQLTPENHGLVILHSKENFAELVKYSEDPGPNLFSHQLLFEEAGMPESLLYVPHARSQMMIDEAQPACVLFKIKNQEREQKYLFSKPISFSMGLRLYQSAKSPTITEEHFNQRRELKSVADLMQSRPKEHIVILPSFSYGDILDPQILAISALQKVNVLGGNLQGSQPAMFFKNRADFALMHTPEVLAYIEKHPSGNYRSYPIENASLPLTVHAMCNKTQAAKVWLEKIDAAILKIYEKPSYTQIYSRVYHTDELKMIKDIMRKHHAGDF